MFLRTYGPWALVTGAARAEGLGYSFARHLAGRGLNLALVDIAGDELAARAEELQTKYLVKVRPVTLDLGRDDFLGALLSQTADITVGLLVCNHMWTPKDTPTIMEMDLATHMAMLNINTRAYTALVHSYGRQMVERAQGGIVIVTSGASLQTAPYPGAYSANKAFQRALGEALWYELQGSGVDVLVAAPGLMDTQGDALANYPQWMISDVDPVAVETLDTLTKPSCSPRHACCRGGWLWRAWGASWPMDCSSRGWRQRKPVMLVCAAVGCQRVDRLGRRLKSTRSHPAARPCVPIV